MHTVPFEERIAEIDAYIELLESIDREAQTGLPEIGESVITAQQQKILYGSVYLQLYNLVEATATWCLSAVTKATSDGNTWKPVQLEGTIRREWVRTLARTHIVLNPEKRFDCTFEFSENLLQEQSLSDWEIEKGGGGSWDIPAIEAISERVGCNLNITPSVKTAAKRHFRDEKNALTFVKDLRNQLAHGSISFEESGANVTVSDLKDLKERTVDYLREVVHSFESYLESYSFLEIPFRPTAGGE